MTVLGFKVIIYRSPWYHQWLKVSQKIALLLTLGQMKWKVFVSNCVKLFYYNINSNNICNNKSDDNMSNNSDGNNIMNRDNSTNDSNTDDNNNCYNNNSNNIKNNNNRKNIDNNNNNSDGNNTNNNCNINSKLNMIPIIIMMIPPFGIILFWNYVQ